MRFRVVYASARQLFFPKAFRIARLAWPAEASHSRGTQADERQDSRSDVSEGDPVSTTSPDGRGDTLLVAEVATGLWRMQRKIQSLDKGGLSDELRGVCRHVESTVDALKAREVEIRDDTGTQYVSGMALKVVAFQPTEGIHQEVICETIRPSVYYKGRLIQRGEVIVGTPRGQHDEPGSPATGASTQTATSTSGASLPQNDAGQDTPSHSCDQREPNVTQDNHGNDSGTAAVKATIADQRKE